MADGTFPCPQLLATGPSAAIFKGECTAGKHAGKKVAIKVCSPSCHIPDSVVTTGAPSICPCPCYSPLSAELSIRGEGQSVASGLLIE